MGVLFALLSGYRCESVEVGVQYKGWCSILSHWQQIVSRDLSRTQWAGDRQPGWTGAGSVSNHSLHFYSTIVCRKVTNTSSHLNIAGPDLGPGQWPPCPRIRSSPSPFSFLQFLDCLGLEANKWKPWIEAYLWELGSETGSCYHLAACHWQFCLKTNIRRELGLKQANQASLRHKTNWFEA